MSQLSKFSSEITKGVAIGHAFKVSIDTAPGGIKLTEEDNVLIQTATIPSRDTLLGELSFNGLKFQVPVGVKFENTISLKMISPIDLRLKHKMDLWCQQFGDLSVNAGGNAKAKLPTVNITIEILDNDLLTPVSTYTLHGAFPTSTGNASLSHGSTEIVQFDTKWAYQYWSSTDNDKTSVSTPIS